MHVVVERDDDGVCCLLPGHCHGSVLRPVGWPGRDFQAPIARAGVAADPLRLLRATGLRSFEFDHLLEVPGFEPWIESRRDSPYVDLSGGLDGYLGRASRSGKDNMGQARRKARKAEEAHGPITFVADSTDANALGALIALKRAQYAATGARDYFSAPERVALAHRLLETRVDGFAGVLSTVHVGPRLLAAHFGIRSGGVLHWWFPVYDPQFGAFAPGWILLRELAVAAPSLGVTQTRPGPGRRRVQAPREDGRDDRLSGLRHREPHRARHATREVPARGRREIVVRRSSRSTGSGVDADRERSRQFDRAAVTSRRKRTSQVTRTGAPRLRRSSAKSRS